jgi:hypothetical protein
MAEINAAFRATKQVMLWHSLPAIVAMAARLDADSTPTGFYAVSYRVFNPVVCSICVIHQYTT